MVPQDGVEPPLAASETAALPLCYWGINWCTAPVLPRVLSVKSRVLRYLSLRCVVSHPGVKPESRASQARVVFILLRGQDGGPGGSCTLTDPGKSRACSLLTPQAQNLVDPRGIAPRPRRLQRRASTWLA